MHIYRVWKTTARYIRIAWPGPDPISSTWHSGPAEEVMLTRAVGATKLKLLPNCD